MIDDRINKADEERRDTAERGNPTCACRRAAETKKKKETNSGPIQKKKKTLTNLQGFITGSPAVVLSCHCNFIATIWKGPGTFPLPSTWQMTNNSRDNLWPVGGKCVRQRADASIITEMVIVGTLKTGYLLDKKVFIRMSELSRGKPSCLLSSTVFPERWLRKHDER